MVYAKIGEQFYGDEAKLITILIPFDRIHHMIRKSKLRQWDLTGFSSLLVILEIYIIISYALLKDISPFCQVKCWNHGINSSHPLWNGFIFVCIFICIDVCTPTPTLVHMPPHLHLHQRKQIQAHPHPHTFVYILLSKNKLW